jgi:hypothetical protein
MTAEGAGSLMLQQKIIIMFDGDGCDDETLTFVSSHTAGDHVSYKTTEKIIVVYTYIKFFYYFRYETGRQPILNRMELRS